MPTTTFFATQSVSAPITGPSTAMTGSLTSGVVNLTIATPTGGSLTYSIDVSPDGNNWTTQNNTLSASSIAKTALMSCLLSNVIGQFMRINITQVSGIFAFANCTVTN